MRKDKGDFYTGKMFDKKYFDDLSICFITT